MKNGGPIALRCGTRPADCGANVIECSLSQTTNHSRFSSYTILQQLQIRNDLLCPEADVKASDRITVSCHPNDAMEV